MKATAGEIKEIFDYLRVKEETFKLEKKAEESVLKNGLEFDNGDCYANTIFFSCILQSNLQSSIAHFVARVKDPTSFLRAFFGYSGAVKWFFW